MSLSPPKATMPVAIPDGVLAKFPEVTVAVPDANGIVTLDVPAEWLPAVVEHLRDDEGYNYLPNIAAVDHIETGQFGMVYHLYRTRDRCRLALRVRVPRDMAVIPSITPLFACADWNEREAFDLMGIVFTGHPHLRRILMPEDWEGHPLRKDYVQAPYELPCAFHDKKTTRV